MRYLNYAITATCLLILNMQVAIPADMGDVGANTLVQAFGNPVSDNDLSEYRGGSALQISEMKIGRAHV